MPDRSRIKVFTKSWSPALMVLCSKRIYYSIIYFYSVHPHVSNWYSIVMLLEQKCSGNPMNDDVRFSLDRCLLFFFFKLKANVFCPCLSGWHPREDQRGAGWNCEGWPGSSAAASIQGGFHQCVAAEGDHRRRDEGSSLHPGRQQC